MSQGYIKIHRKIFEWEWYSDVNTKCLFFHLLLSANHTEKKWRGVLIKRGEVITSLSNLATETNLSVRNVRTALNRLKSTHEVTIKTTNKYTLIKLVKYSDYQGSNEESDTQNDTQDDKRVTTNKNEKEEKNKKKEIEKKESELKIPDFINKDLWNAFIEMRKKTKKTPTEYAIKLILSDLSAYEEDLKGGANLALENSIKSNWMGIFKPKPQKESTAQKKGASIQELYESAQREW